MNLLNTELLKSYSGDYTENYGEWVQRNGIWAMRLGPGPIYNSNTDHLGLTAGEFKENTLYIFDFWIDTDDIYYTSGSKQVPGGMRWKYTDDTSSNIVATGDISSPVGWLHIQSISTAGKTIKGICPYYWIATPAYYRFDSSITEYKDTELNKNGLFSTGILKENGEGFNKGGIVQVNNFIEL